MTEPKIFNETIIDALRYHALHSPDKPAYTFLNQTQKETLTYQGLLERVTGMAAHLSLSVAPGSRALLLLQPGLDYIVSFLSCLMSGIIVIPMYPPRGNRHEKRLVSIINDAKASLVIATEAIQSSFDLLNVQWIFTDKECWKIPDQISFPPLTRENLAFLQYTSGSTGSPKGVMITHGNIMANTLASHQIMAVEHRTLCSWLPPFHDMGLIGAILYPLIHNIHSILMAPTTFLKNPFIWLKTISDYRVALSPAPNFAYEMCANLITEMEKKELDLSCWKMALNGAEPVNAKTLTRFSEAFRSCGFQAEFCYPAYGMAETTLMVSGKAPCSETKILQISKSVLQKQNKLELNPSGNDFMSIVGCGYPASNHAVKIIDPQTMIEIPPFQIGEIIVTGPSVSQGYWGKNELNEALFGLKLSHSDDKYLRTGDLGFIDEEGELFVTGRLKDLIIIRGYNLYPQDIENMVSDSHPALIKHGCAAFMVEIAGESELVIVQEVHRHASDKEQIFDAILKQCAQELPLLPAHIVLIPQLILPKTSSGKVQRKACREAFIQNQLKVIEKWDRAKIESVPQESSQQENHLIQWMKEWLSSRINVPQESINIQTNLAYYGLDSSLAIQFCGALEQHLHQEINPSLLWTYSTLSDLSQYLLFGIKKGSQEAVSQQAQMEPIAIIGMSCHFPGDSSSPEAFWELLSTKKDGISSIPEERWEKDAYPDIINKGGFIKNIDRFDASLFNISRREAQVMDPQHRILLELSFEALERAGIAPLSLQESNTGVFIGIASNDYSQLLREHLDNTDTYYGIGNAHSAAAGRIAYFLGTHGETIALDTEVFFSLVPVLIPCQNLQENECDLALVGGVNIILDPALYISFSKAGMLSPDGACKTFDAEANGYVRSEGAGMVVLKRLRDAKRDNDTILAVIQGMAVNSDGHSNGITAPDARAQSELIKKALHTAGLAADNISYIEAHGTGTSLGDPIEFSALKEVFATGTRQLPLYIGSVKSNIGHLEAGAGMAGLIKTVLMLQHGQILPNLHFNRINPLIDLESLPAEVPTELQTWQNPSRRYAGVSSFGFTGTNAHIILSEYPSKAPLKSALPSRPVEIASLSATTYAFQRQSYWFDGEKKKEALNSGVTNSCYKTEWRQLILPNKPQVLPEVASKGWLIFTSLNPSECKLAKQLKKRMPHAIFIYPSKGEQSILNDDSAHINPLKPAHFLQVCTYYPDIQGVIYLWGMVKNELDLIQNPDHFILLSQACSGFLHVTQALIANKINPGLWNITCATASIHEQIIPLMAPLVGMGKTLLLEHPDFFYQHIDVSQNESPEQIANLLLDSIVNKKNSSFMAYEKGVMYLQRLRPANMPSDSFSEQLLQDATYLITGGLGGIGTIVRQWLLSHKVKSIVLIGRKALNPQIIAQIDSNKTADTQISYIQADVTQYSQLEAVLKKIDKEQPPIKGIFHTAGILKDASWEQLSWDACEQVFAAKITGTWNLHRVSMDYAPHLKFFVLFSSISSELGSPGQANYAGANAYMDALAHYRIQNGLPALSINWGPWDNIGMSQNLRPFWQDYGIDSITNNLGLRALNLILSKERQIAFIPNHVTREKIALLPPIYQSILKNLIAKDTFQKTGGVFLEDEEVAASSVSKQKGQGIVIQKEQVSQFLLDEIRKVLNLDKKTPVSINSSLLSLGMDSISAGELVSSIQKNLGIHTISIQTLLFENHALEKIISILEEKLGEQEQKQVDIKQENCVPSLTFLAPAQMAIWKYIHEQPFNNAYIVSSFFTLEGSVNPQFLEQSIQSVIQNHPVLQSGFYEVLGNPMQHQESSISFKLQFEDLRQLPQEQRDRHIERMEEAFSHYQFNLSKAPLITSYLIQCTEQQFVWGITFSRLMADAHSTLIIYRDILKYYLHYQSGVTIKHQESGSYYSYVNQHMEAMVNGTYERSIAFWQQELGNYCPKMRFTNTSGDEITKMKGLKQTFRILEEDYSLLLQVSKAIEVTPANVLFSVYCLLLIEHCGTKEAFISILCSGRNDTEYQETVGDFSSEIHLCLKYYEGFSFQELAQHAQSRVTSLLPYQNIQPEQLTELGLPLPRVSFDFQNISLDVENLPFKPIPRSIRSDNTPLWGRNPRALSLKLSHTNNQISGYFKYRLDLFDSQTITHLSRRFLDLLHKILQEPESLCAQHINKK